MLYPPKQSFNFNGEIRTFQEKDKLTWLMSTQLALQKILIGIFTQKRMKNNHKHKRPGKKKIQKRN
jgi:hypothetical protein